MNKQQLGLLSVMLEQFEKDYEKDMKESEQTIIMNMKELIKIWIQDER